MQLRPFLITAFLSIAVLLSFNSFSQRTQPPGNKQPYNRSIHPLHSVTFKKPWSWNLLFKPGASQATRDKEVQDLERRAQKAFTALLKKNPAYTIEYQPKLLFNVFTCPCDSLLVTLHAGVILAGTGKVATQPPTDPITKGGGNQVRVIDYNYAVTNKDTILVNPNYNNRYSREKKDSILTIPDNPLVDASNILAIMDTGLDPDFFPAGIKKLIWTSPDGTTLYNFLPGRLVGDKMDDHPEKHGSAVTGMALGQINNGKKAWPTIMVMKVLDSSKAGSSFSVSCALSYALQHHARVINMSLGYYTEGKPDSVLNHYISKCMHALPTPLTIFAAAGNTNNSHDVGSLCKNPNTNKLNPGNLFYPACLSTAYTHLISVTGLVDGLKSSCFYQNYSPTYVKVGLVKTSNSVPACCTYVSPFSGKKSLAAKLYEGTSFATPIVSGKVMNALLAGPPVTSALNALQSLIQKGPASLKSVTVKGSYIPY